jgi:hypothetical protein
MQKPYDIRRYDFGCYDEHLCLKPPIALVVATALLCRDVILPFVGIVSSFKAQSGDIMSMIAGTHASLWFVTALPALLVLYALMNRVPRGNRLARAVWRRGRALLVLAVLLQSIPLLRYVRFDVYNRAGDDSFAALLLLVMLFIILVYVLRSARVADSFSDFRSSIERAICAPNNR